jgi:adenylate kinase
VDFLVLLGPPGAGKGTLSRQLQQDSGFLPVSTGEWIRREMADPASKFGRLARPHMDRGDYIPDAAAMELFFHILKSSPEALRLVLDGFPRTIPQAETFMEWVVREGHRLLGAVHLDLDGELAVERMRLRRVCSICRTPYHLQWNPPRRAEVCDLCGGGLILREDDDPERVARRLQRFRDQTDPLIRWFDARGCLVRLDGALPPGVLAGQAGRLFNFL